MKRTRWKSVTLVLEEQLKDAQRIMIQLLNDPTSPMYLEEARLLVGVNKELFKKLEERK